MKRSELIINHWDFKVSWWKVSAFCCSWMHWWPFITSLKRRARRRFIRWWCWCTASEVCCHEKNCYLSITYHLICNSSIEEPWEFHVTCSGIMWMQYEHASILLRDEDKSNFCCYRIIHCQRRQWSSASCWVMQNMSRGQWMWSIVCSLFEKRTSFKNRRDERRNGWFN